MPEQTYPEQTYPEQTYPEQTYEVTVSGVLPAGVRSDVQHVVLVHEQVHTVARTHAPDRPALLGLLHRVRALGLEVVALRRLAVLPRPRAGEPGAGGRGPGGWYEITLARAVGPALLGHLGVEDATVVPRRLTSSFATSRRELSRLLARLTSSGVELVELRLLPAAAVRS